MIGIKLNNYYHNFELFYTVFRFIFFLAIIFIIHNQKMGLETLSSSFSKSEDRRVSLIILETIYI